MLVWILSFVLVFSMLSLALAQETKPAGPPSYRSRDDSEGKGVD